MSILSVRDGHCVAFPAVVNADGYSDWQLATRRAEFSSAIEPSTGAARRPSAGLDLAGYAPA